MAEAINGGACDVSYALSLCCIMTKHSVQIIGLGRPLTLETDLSDLLVTGKSKAAKENKTFEVRLIFFRRAVHHS